jgi:hypothetical protein
MRPALPLGQRLIGRFPRFGSEQRRVAQRNPNELADIRISGIVFILNRRPFTGKIHLGDSRNSEQEQECNFHGKAPEEPGIII